ncbi:SGNH/GDSL hydrolase family protein [Nocardia yunnanensis]|uniref:SGNH/GDSL hydrolase family protein n=1 Tax=Nocardia yunnanensis TaxID=2382165 RepID=A0A386Z7X6_9NOCA|nr:SGNH/GDSL hydrolase family protein [Nocardia yunnanensis]AYF72569.1 SGNH/GDSL hydrolase family protein [Nocardia yunnanensis]
MLGNTVRRLCATAAAVAMTAAGGAVTAAGEAGADPAPAGKELVALGDSFSANVWNIIEQETDCKRHGKTSWPMQLAGLMGVAEPDSMSNPSCPGAAIDSGPGWTLAQQAQRADKEGAFGPNTKVVTIQFGLNDKWGKSDQTLWNSLQDCVFNLALGCEANAVDEGRMPDYTGVSGSLMAKRMSNAITYIKYYAPNAHIVFVGYPEVFVPGSSTVCLSILGVAPFVNPRATAVVEYFDRIDQAQREAAQQLGIEFLDARALTAGHGLCSSQPWLNGVADPRADIDGLFFHPSTQGDSVVAHAIYDRYGH